MQVITVLAALLSLYCLIFFPSQLNLVIFLLVAIANFFSWSVSLNLRRFLRAQQEGVFRGKEI
jgi:ABC-type microcin C transport system permease subunit YejE